MYLRPNSLRQRKAQALTQPRGKLASLAGSEKPGVGSAPPRRPSRRPRQRPGRGRRR